MLHLAKIDFLIANSDRAYFSFFSSSREFLMFNRFHGFRVIS